MVRIVKNELGGSATQQELRGWGVKDGHNGMDRGTGGYKPPNPRQFEPWAYKILEINVFVRLD